MSDARAVLLLSLACVGSCAGSAAAGPGFTVAGRPVAPEETNFAGARVASPVHRVVVQVNHDARGDVSLDLAVVDDVYRALRDQHRREPYFALDALPLVVIADVKMRRFLDGPQRLLFGRLEGDVKRAQDVYPSPNAIFVSDESIADPARLRTALRRALGYLFDGGFHQAVTGLDRARPRPAD
jgi:hypothetical protein